MTKAIKALKALSEGKIVVIRDTKYRLNKKGSLQTKYKHFVNGKPDGYVWSETHMSFNGFCEMVESSELKFIDKKEK